MQSLESVPTWFADFLGIELNAGQVILSLVVVLAFLLPTLLLSKGNKLPPFFALFGSLTLLVGIGWAPLWLLITTVFLMAIVGAMFGRDAIMGKG
jgi:hypothetical protein